MTYSTAISCKGSASGVRPKKSRSTFNRLASMPISRLIAVSSSLGLGAFAKVAVATAYRSAWAVAAECEYENPVKVHLSWLAVPSALMGSLVKISRNPSLSTLRGMLEILKARDLRELFDGIDERLFPVDRHSHVNTTPVMPAKSRTSSDRMLSITLVIIRHRL